MLELLHARPEEPPRGGIFLSSELTQSKFIEQLIQLLPEYQEASALASQELERLFPRTQSDPLQPDPYADYQRMVMKEMIQTRTPNPEVLAYISHIEDIKEQAGRYADARAAVMKFGEDTVEYLQPLLAHGPHLIGSHTYEVLYDSRPNRERPRLVGFDEVTGENVYFNYWENIAWPMSRAAWLPDYMRLIGDVTMEQTRLRSS